MKNGTLAIAISLAGSRAALARELKVGRQAVWNWERQGWVPAARALEIAGRYGLDRMALIKPELRATVAAFAAR